MKRQDEMRGDRWQNVFRVFINGNSMPQRADSLFKAAIAALEQFEREGPAEGVTRILLIAEDESKRSDD